LGYAVHGVIGAKVFRGYGSMLRYNFPGAASCDVLLAGLLHIERKPHRAFSLLASKDMRGVSAKLSANSNPKLAAR